MAREPLARSQADSAVDPTLAQKKRARHRLVGAVALCLLAALLIPLVLESEPRQPLRDIPLEIDPRSQPVPAQPLPGPAAGAAASASTPAAGEHAGATAPAASEPARSTVRPVEAGTPAAAATPRAEVREPRPELRPELRTEPRPVARAEPRPEHKSEPRPEHKPEAKSTPKAEPRTEARADGKAKAEPRAKAEPKAEPRPTPAPAGDPLAGIIKRTDPQQREPQRHEPAPPPRGRFLVQVGAYSSARSAKAISERVAGVGLKPYHETVKVDSGSVTRVRVGPFDSREAAERAMGSLKAAGIPAVLVGR